MSEVRLGESPERSAAHPATPAEPARLSREAYALLAQANLLRMRGEWPEATEKCMAALRLSPDNPSAQSLLGDIYDNQGRLDDAIQWYRMALDVQPDSPADTIKLARLLDLKARELASPRRKESEAPAPPAAPSQPPWVGRWRSDPEGILRRLAFVAGAVAVLTVFAAFLFAHRSAALLLPGGSHQVAAPPVVVPSLAPPPPAPNSATNGPAPADPAEASLLTSLRASPVLTEQGVTVVSATIDPRAGNLTLTLTCRPPAATPMDRGAVLCDATKALQLAAQQTDPQTITRFTVRCLLASAAPGGSAPLIFTADATRPAVTALGPDPSQASPAQIAAVYTNPWWASSAGL